MFRAIKVRLKQMSKRLSKNDLYLETVYFFLDYVFVKVFRDRVFRAIRVRLKKMSKRLS